MCRLPGLNDTPALGMIRPRRAGACGERPPWHSGCAPLGARPRLRVRGTASARHQGPAMLDMHTVVGRANVLFVTLDCLRYDVASRALADGLTPHLAALLPP